MIQTPREEIEKPYSIPRGDDPTGQLQRLSKEWRPNPRPKFYRLDESGNLLNTKPEVLEAGDFVEVTAFLDLVTKERHDGKPNTVSVGLGLQSIIQLMTNSDVQVSERD